MTFCKRKKGIIKKAIKLSILCVIDIFLVIMDKNEKPSIFSTKKRYLNSFINIQNIILILK